MCKGSFEVKNMVKASTEWTALPWKLLEFYHDRWGNQIRGLFDLATADYNLAWLWRLLFFDRRFFIIPKCVRHSQPRKTFTIRLRVNTIREVNHSLLVTLVLYENTDITENPILPFASPELWIGSLVAQSSLYQAQQLYPGSRSDGSVLHLKRGVLEQLIRRPIFLLRRWVAIRLEDYEKLAVELEWVQTFQI